MKIKCKILIFALMCLPGNLKGEAIVEAEMKPPFSLNNAGTLAYTKDAKGNRLPDFSHVGYYAGEKGIPDVPVRLRLKPSGADDGRRIQNALDQLGKLPPDSSGHRGTLLLERGEYRVAGTLKIVRSGIVLRGEGNGKDGTVLIATGYDDRKYKRSLIRVGNDSKIRIDKSSKTEISQNYVAIGTHQFAVKSAKSYKVGDRIVVYRPSTAKWISSIGCDRIKPKWTSVSNVRWIEEGKRPGVWYSRRGTSDPTFISKSREENWDEFRKRVPISADEKKLDTTIQWKAGSYDLYFERRITKIEGNDVTIDAPIVHAMDRNFGGGAIFKFSTINRIQDVGIENIRLISEFSKPIKGHPYGDPQDTTKKDNHAWNAIKLDRNTEHIWVRNVTGNYFGWSLISATGNHATIQDCINLGHASVIDGGRRYSFMIKGQLNLMQRCLTFEGRHEFVNQAKTQGPNAFVDCIGLNSKSSAGPHHRYAVGNLYDNVKSEKPMESRYRGNSGTGHGWAGTQTCFYNCVAPGFNVQAPAGGISWVLGSGKSNRAKTRLAPSSLYYQQVRDRLGIAALERLATEEQRKSIGKYKWAEERLEAEGKDLSK